MSFPQLRSRPNAFGGFAVTATAAPPPPGTRGLFRTPPLTGAGIGGSFFRDPLQGAPAAVPSAPRPLEDLGFIAVEA